MRRIRWAFLGCLVAVAPWVLGIPVQAATLSSSGVALTAMADTNLPQKAGNFSLAQTIPATVTITNVDIQGNQVLSLEGNVTENGRTTPFDLSGTLYQGTTPNELDGVLTDSLGNFKVVRFAINANPAKGLFFTRNSKGNEVALYLEYQGTRNVVFLEAPATRVLGNSTVAAASATTQLAHTQPQAPRAALLWPEYLFAPDKTTRTISNTPPGGTATSQATALSTTFGGSTPQLNEYISYVDYYDLPANNPVTDTMTIQLTVLEPTTGNNSNFGAQITVNQTTYDETALNIVNDVSNWQVLAPAGAALEVPQPEYLWNESYYGSVEQAPTLAIEPSWSASTYGFGLSLTYTPLSDTKLNHSGQSCLSGQICSFETTSGTYMQQAGQYIQVTWDSLTNYASSTAVTDQVMISYYMYNSFTYSTGENGGTQTYVFPFQNTP